MTRLMCSAFLLLAAGALLGTVDRAPLRRLLGSSESPRPESTGRLVASAGARRALAVVVGLCVLAGFGGWGGMLFGGFAAAAVDRLLARRPDPDVARASEAADRDLPLALDLLACALRAGAPPSIAAVAVAEAVRGPVGAALTAVARGTALGSPPEAAWQPLGQLPGAGAAARTLARATGSGTRLAAELSRTAQHLRSRRASATDARVRRAGVLVVLPLGLCFLPAFVCIGVVPIVLGVAGTILR